MSAILVEKFHTDDVSNTDIPVVPLIDCSVHSDGFSHACGNQLERIHEFFVSNLKGLGHDILNNCLFLLVTSSGLQRLAAQQSSIGKIMTNNRKQLG